LRFDQGLSSQLDVIDAERGLLLAELDRIAAERDLRFRWPICIMPGRQRRRRQADCRRPGMAATINTGAMAELKPKNRASVENFWPALPTKDAVKTPSLFAR